MADTNASTDDHSAKVESQGKSTNIIAAHAISVTKHVRIIRKQQQLQCERVPRLPDHQSAVKRQGKIWENNIWPLMIKTTEQIVSFAGDYDQIFKRIRSLIPDLRKNVGTAKEDFMDGLRLIIEMLDEKITVADDIKTKVQTFHDSFQDSYLDILKDFKGVDDYIAEEQDELWGKEGERNKLIEKKSELEIAMITLGAALGAAIPAVATATVFTSPTGVGLIVGCCIVAGSSIALAGIAGEYAETMRKKHRLDREINQLNDEVSQLKIIEEQIRGLGDHTSACVDHSAQVRDGWIDLKYFMESELKDVEKISPEESAFRIETRMDLARNAWEKVRVEAEKLQVTNLEEKDFASPEDMIKSFEEGISRGA